MFPKKQTIGGLSNNGAIPLGTQNTSGVLGGSSSSNGAINLGQSSGTPIPVSQGSNTGMLPKDTAMKGVSTPPVVNVGGKSQVMKGSPSVLAQQQALNKLGAGLVEDGMAGDLTKAAIAKYGSGASTTDTKKTNTQPNTQNDQQKAGMINPTTGTNANNSTTTPNYTPPNQGTQGVSQGGLIGNAVSMSQTPSPAYTAAQTEANRINQQIEDAKAQFAKQTSDINQSGTWTSRALGEQGQANIQNSATLAALGSQYQGATNQVGQANTQQGLQQSALGTAINANAPIQQPYSNMLINPATGQPYSQSGGTLQDAVSGVAQKLTNGQMTYNDALQALSGYGQGGVNALQQALPPGFNVAQSNTLAGTQGTIKPAFDYAKLAMDNLKTSFGNLSVPGQGSNVQPIADVSNWFSNISGIGKEAVRTKEGALAEARSAIQKVLASIQGGTPTDYTGQSHALLPDNATPADVDAAMQNLQTLGQGKVDIYGNPGQANNTSGSTTGGSIWNF